MKIIYSTITKTGKRHNNEDSFRIVEYDADPHYMAVVCDGMGGHAMGEVASENVADAIVDYWTAHTDVPDSTEKVIDACHQAMETLDKRSDAMGHIEMGSTMVMVSMEGNIATIAYVGDSRCYLQRPGEGLIYQTEDHVGLSFGWEVVTRCFFSYHRHMCVPDIAQFEVKIGDRILLCSDGVYKSMPPEILKERMMDKKSLDDIIDVYDFLCDRNGDDNYTAVLMEITE